MGFYLHAKFTKDSIKGYLTDGRGVSDSPNSVSFVDVDRSGNFSIRYFQDFGFHLKKTPLLLDMKPQFTKDRWQVNCICLLQSLKRKFDPVSEWVYITDIESAGGTATGKLHSGESLQASMGNAQNHTAQSIAMKFLKKNVWGNDVNWMKINIFAGNITEIYEPVSTSCH